MRSFFFSLFFLAVMAGGVSGCELKRPGYLPPPPLNPEDLSDKQALELIGYLDSMEYWEANGRPDPEPVPPDWLRPYLGPDFVKSPLSRKTASPELDPVADWVVDATPPPSVPPAVQADPRPVVTVYHSSGYCGAYERFSAWLKSLSVEERGKLPVSFKPEIDDTRVCPTFYFSGGSKWWTVEGWSGPEAFLRSWGSVQAIKQFQVVKPVQGDQGFQRFRRGRRR
jgi:predicted small lipoprotein YifL